MNFLSGVWNRFFEYFCGSASVGDETPPETDEERVLLELGLGLDLELELAEPDELEHLEQLRRGFRAPFVRGESEYLAPDSRSGSEDSGYMSIGSLDHDHDLP